MAMTTERAKEKLAELQEKLAAYNHAAGLISYDGATTAPKDTAENRARTLSVLSGELYRLTTCSETVDLLELLDSRKSELNAEECRMTQLLLKNIRDMQKLPMEEYVAYQELLVKSDDVWHRAKESSDFELFRPFLEEIFETTGRFASYLAPEKDSYDYWLGEYEDGLDRAICDNFFAELRSRIVPLISEISKRPQIDDGIRYGSFPREKQEELSLYLMELMGLDLGHVGLSTTEHPFTTSLGSHLDERITTHYIEEDFVSSMFSVIHEGGHALYDTGSAPEYAFTVLDGGVSMGIHESQSRFYENILGRSEAFCSLIFPKIAELFPQLSGRSPREFYLAVNKIQPSLIRTEADELTYPLHIMVRYELEKRIMSGELKVKELPEEWNRLYRDYLGVEVPDDRSGVLQDSHWSGGAIGYFPSYALGSAYGAQFLAKMKETVDVENCLSKGNFGPINSWNREHIWKYGCLYKPGELLEKALGEPFSPGYYIDYLENKVKSIYGI